MTKNDLLSALLNELTEKITLLKSALADSEEGASGSETKSEGKYDTRAIEASYLAEAQAEQLAQAEESRRTLENFSPPPFKYSDKIAPGALVEVEQDNEISFYLLAPTAGGLTAEYLGCEATIITPESRLYGQLLNQKPGATLTNPTLTILGVE